MPQEFRIRITNLRTDEAGECSGVIPDEEWRVLQLFAECANDLRETAAVRKGCRSRYTVEFDQKAGFRVSGETLEPDVLRALLWFLRPFILKDEDTYFLRVTGILGKHVEHPLFGGMLRQHKKRFQGDQLRSMFKVSVNDELINGKTALNRWLNAYHYHRDQDKRAALESLHVDLPVETSEPLFVHLLIDKVKSILDVADIIEGMVRRDGQVVIGYRHRSGEE